MLCIAQAEYMIEALKLGEIESGQGLNQEMGLARPGENLVTSNPLSYLYYTSKLYSLL